MRNENQINEFVDNYPIMDGFERGTCIGDSLTDPV